MNQYEGVAHEHHQTVIIEPVRPAMAYHHNGNLYLEEGADLPPGQCVCCGRKAIKTVRKYLRTPSNPLTWFGKTRQVEFGLCRKHADSILVGTALTYSLLIVGLLVMGVGIAFQNKPAIVLGAVAASVSGLFRALMPIYTPKLKVEPIQIRGNAGRYLESVPEVEFEDEGNELAE